MIARMLLPLLAAAALLTGCERPPMHSQQQGWRGTGMVEIDNPRTLAKQKAALPALPELPPAASDEGPRAREVYQNVKVLGDLSVAEFTRHMVAFSAWVAPPAEGCNYCHDGGNFADDSKYTKVVARRMIEMTRHVNADWSKHVGETGVTCYTCHRGQPVPPQVWSAALEPKNNRVGSGLGDDAGQNKALPSIVLASLPYDPYSSYLAGGKEGTEPIRVQTNTALPTGNRASTKQAEFTYSLMNHMSDSLGVNCTFCHNTQSFQHWNDKRVTAWHGIRMAQDLNSAFVTPLTDAFPASRRGPAGDIPKVFCATCHQGVNKPLDGLKMAKDFSGLISGPAAPSAPAASSTSAAPSAPAASSTSAAPSTPAGPSAGLPAPRVVQASAR